MDNINTIVQYVFPVLLLILGVWRHGWIYYLLAGFAWVLIGLSFWTVNSSQSILMVLVGLASFGGAIWDRK